ncbi:hypothetical protein EU546_06230 [Candidatus Thorarchaeota archaeon]|nr:MAG: hypothetical protein EU546_06230 [Candidatus Thorarchaeota archaeon]
MVSRSQALKGFLSHVALLFVNFCVFVGIIESLDLFNLESPLPWLNVLLLGFMLVHTFILLSLQLAIQVLELIRMRMPTVLVTYYFQFSDQEAIPLWLLDPIRSRLGVLVLILIITGGIAFYPIFAVYGLLLVWGHLTTIALHPQEIVRYFGIFLNWAPPLFLVVFVVVILSVLAIEFRHA